jgi:hypothetical protein
VDFIPFEFWDSENGRFQDLRGSYGVGLKFFFIGGLQFNWVWAKRIPYTQYVYPIGGNGFPDTSVTPTPEAANTDDLISEFFISFSW